MLLKRGSKLHPHPPNNSANNLCSYPHDLKVQKANRSTYLHLEGAKSRFTLSINRERNYMRGTDCNT